MMSPFAPLMRASARALVLCVLAFSVESLAAADETAAVAAPHARTIRRHALLVGCTRYDHYPDQSLEGPVNDVSLMRKTLIERCSFQPDDIRTLSEAADAGGRPTRANIAAGFEQLAKAVRRGDQVVILLAGHGSQQPDDHHDPLHDPEADGLDETFLPCDVEHWDGDRVTNAIIDDELGRWTQAIAVHGVLVWVIFDSCHSGTALRGDSPFVLRRLEPTRLQVPKDSLAAGGVRGSPDSIPADIMSRGSLEGVDTTQSVIALYAAQPFETEKECLLPPEGNDQNWQGLLSYSVCQILQQGPPPTYRELQQRILAQYRQWGWFEPTPLVEGVQLDRVILDEKARPARYQLNGGRSEGWKIAGGRLHGLTENSILAVSEAIEAAEQAEGKPAEANSTEDKEQAVAYVRVISNDMTESVVEPCAYADQPAVKDLPLHGLCRVVYADLGSLKLRVAVDTAANSSDPGLQTFAARLKSLSEAEGALFSVTSKLAQAHWVLQLRDGRYWLLPADLATMLDPLPWDATRFEVAADVDDAQLCEALDRAARVRNLLAVAQPFGTSEKSAAAERPDFAVGFEMLRLRDKQDRQGERLAAERGIVLKPNDWVAWRITNQGTSAADVTLLFVDSQLAIVPLFPRPNTIGDNRLEAGASFLTAPVRVTAKTTGREQVVAIAVKSQGPPRDFLFLSQASLTSSLATRGSEDDSPLAQLLKFANYRVGGTRGVDQATLQSYSVQFIPWSVEDSSRHH
jgi:hypothetical protein